MLNTIFEVLKYISGSIAFIFALVVFFYYIPILLYQIFDDL